MFWPWYIWMEENPRALLLRVVRSDNQSPLIAAAILKINLDQGFFREFDGSTVPHVDTHQLFHQASLASLWQASSQSHPSHGSKWQSCGRIEMITDFLDGEIDFLHELLGKASCCDCNWDKDVHTSPWKMFDLLRMSRSCDTKVVGFHLRESLLLPYDSYILICFWHSRLWTAFSCGKFRGDRISKRQVQHLATSKRAHVDRGPRWWAGHSVVIHPRSWVTIVSHDPVFVQCEAPQWCLLA